MADFLDVIVRRVDGTDVCNISLPRDCSLQELTAEIAEQIDIDCGFSANDVLLLDGLVLDADGQSQPFLETEDDVIELTWVSGEGLAVGDLSYYTGPYFCLILTSAGPYDNGLYQGSRAESKLQTGARCRIQTKVQNNGMVVIADFDGYDDRVRMEVHITQLSRSPLPALHPMADGYAVGDLLYYIGPDLSFQWDCGRSANNASVSSQMCHVAKSIFKDRKQPDPRRQWKLQHGMLGTVIAPGVLPGYLRLTFDSGFGNGEVACSVENLSREMSGSLQQQCVIS